MMRVGDSRCGVGCYEWSRFASNTHLFLTTCLATCGSNVIVEPDYQVEVFALTAAVVAVESRLERALVFDIAH